LPGGEGLKKDTESKDIPGEDRKSRWTRVRAYIMNAGNYFCYFCFTFAENNAGTSANIEGSARNFFGGFGRGKKNSAEIDG